MSEKITKFLRSQAITSVIYILIGSALAFMPVESVNIICKLVFGVILILSGIYHILFYILDKPTTTIFDLFSGVILIVFGIFLFRNPQIIVKLLPTLLGGFILVDCVWTIRAGIRLKKAGSGAWKWLLLCSVIFLGLGTAMILNPFKVIRYTIIFCGAVLIANGVFDLIFQLVLYFGLKHANRKTDQEEVMQENGEQAPENQDSVYTDWNQRGEDNYQDDNAFEIPSESETEKNRKEEQDRQDEQDNDIPSLDHPEIPEPELILAPDLNEKEMKEDESAENV